MTTRMFCDVMHGVIMKDGGTCIAMTTRMLCNVMHGVKMKEWDMHRSEEKDGFRTNYAIWSDLVVQ